MTKFITYYCIKSIQCFFTERLHTPFLTYSFSESKFIFNDLYSFNNRAGF